MAREAFEQAVRSEIKAFGIERCRERVQPGLLLAHGDGADHRTEDQPRRWRVLIAACRPGKTRAANQSAIDANRIRPIEIDRLFRWRVHRKCVGECGQSGIKRAPRRAQRLFGLQHDGEFGEIEAADMDQRAGTGIGGNLACMRKGVADLTQRDGAERRRQIE